MLTRHTQKNLTWIDLVAPTAPEVRALMQEFGFDPHIAQELLSASAKSSVERYDDALYAVFHFPTVRGRRADRSTQEVDFVIGRHYLITTRYEPVSALEAFSKSYEVDVTLETAPRQLHGGQLFTTIMRSMYRNLLVENDFLKGKLDEIEQRLFLGREKQMVLEISQVGQNIYDVRQALLPHGEMLRSLEAPGERMFGQEFSYYLRGVIAEYERARGDLDGMRDSMTELRETNNSLLNAKQNEIMKNFSVLAFVFVPVSLMMGVYQMNLPNTPFAGQIDFWILLSSIVILSLALFIYFRRKGWL